MEKIIFEHKSLNDEIRAAQSVVDLHPMYHDQVQQQLYISEADKCFFMASKWTDDGELIEEKHFWIYPNKEHQERIVAGWDQFEKDLETFEPQQVPVKAKATIVDDLLLPSIVVTGQIAVESNLDLFGDALHDFISRINIKPENDEDFVNIGKAIKALERAEEWLDNQEEGVISKFDQLNQTIALKNTLKELARENRLMLQKIDKAEKENRKAQIVSVAFNALSDHLNALQAELPVQFNFKRPSFPDAIKGKKTILSMQDSVNTMLANAKIESDALARDLREKHTWFIENAGEYSFLFSDLASIIYKAKDDFQAVVTNRIAQHKEQERIKAEAAAKAQAEREARIAAEAAEKAALAERNRIIEEEKAKAKEELAKAYQEDNWEYVNDSKKAGKEVSNTEAVADASIEQKPVFNKEIQAESKAVEIIPSVVVDESNDLATPPFRDELIAAIAMKFFVDNDLAEQWLIDEFSNG